MRRRGGAIVRRRRHGLQRELEARRGRTRESRPGSLPGHLGPPGPGPGRTGPGH